ESYFIVISQPKTDEAKSRIKAIVELRDGFKIAEEDLRIRGPGEFFGKRQHGLNALKIANPITQMRLLKNARDEAIKLLRNDPNLSLKQNQQLLVKVKNNFPQFPDLDIVM
ncbi:MAG: DNA helicase RecG, partial [Candidatus Omnitrophica bacterium]|nr:DNA helicase RecG [Candidatus Omnitrophota bacterium]